MTYNPSIPAINTRIDQTYNLITTNFTQLNNIFANDHYEWNFITAGDRGLHRKTTLLEQGADPAAGANRGEVYTKDVGGITELFYRYDTSANPAGRIIQLSCVKGWCRFNGSTLAITDQNNVATITRPGGSPVGVYSVNFTRPLGNANYSVLVTMGRVFPTNTMIANISATTVNGCTIEMRRCTNGNILEDVVDINVLIVGN